MLPYYGAVRLTSPYGTRADPFTGRATQHNGIDLVGADKRIRAVKGGTVARSRIVTDPNNATSQWGNYIAITSDDGLTRYYCHLSQRLVQAGQTVTAGQQIGVEGATGRATGSHLHYEVRRGTQYINAAIDLGIPNTVGAVQTPAEPDYAAIVTAKCGFERQTVDYINRYQYAPDLWRKLWEQMR